MIRLVAATLLLAGSQGGVVTHQEFLSVERGDTKHVVQETFGTTGELVVEWVGGKGWHHRWKNYPTKSGDTVQVVYFHSPHGHIWRLAKEGWCPEAHTPCSDDESGL